MNFESIPGSQKEFEDEKVVCASIPVTSRKDFDDVEANDFDH